MRQEIPLPITDAFHFSKMEVTPEYQDLFTNLCVGAAEIRKQSRSENAFLRVLTNQIILVLKRSLNVAGFEHYKYLF